MNLKPWVPFLILISTLVTGLYLFLSPAKVSLPPAAGPPLDTASPAAPNDTKNAPSVLDAGTGLIPAAARTTDLAARAAQAAPPAATAESIPPAIVLENVNRAIRQYGVMFGGNPVGTNPEITAALNGGNPKQVNFINPEAGMRINENGELVDAWGTPFFFHQLSGQEMEIRSAGEDRKMWTRDDQVAK